MNPEISPREIAADHHEDGETVSDERWFGRFMELFEPVDFAVPQGALQQKWQAFIQGDVRNPDLRISYDIDGIRMKIEAWEVLKKDIEEQEKNVLLQHAYREKIEQQISFQRAKWFLQKGDMGLARMQMERVFPPPEEAQFAHVVFHLRQELQHVQHKNNIPPALRLSAEQLLSCSPEASDDREGYRPSKQVLGYFFNQNRGFVKHCVEILAGALPAREGRDDMDTYESRDMVHALQRIHAAFDLPPWDIEETSERSTMAVDQRRRKTLIPTGRTFSRHEINKFAIQESGHLLIRKPAEHSGIKLFTIGLAGYEESEEGFFRLLDVIYEHDFEQKAVELDQLGHVDRYLALGLAYGYGNKIEGPAGPPRRDFREVFEVMKRYYAYKDMLTAWISGEEEIQRNPDENETIVNSTHTRQAFQVCTRLFSGTDGSDAGCNPKIGIYYTGPYKVLQAGEEDPIIFSMDLFGKKDFTNPLHNELARMASVLNTISSTTERTRT